MGNKSCVPSVKICVHKRVSACISVCECMHVDKCVCGLMDKRGPHNYRLIKCCQGPKNIIFVKPIQYNHTHGINSNQSIH